MKKSICATIRIIQEIWCLPYAGFFKTVYDTFDFEGLGKCQLQESQISLGPVHKYPMTAPLNYFFFTLAKCSHILTLFICIFVKYRYAKHGDKMTQDHSLTFIPTKEKFWSKGVHERSVETTTIGLLK